MKRGMPLNVLAAALHHAQFIGLPDYCAGEVCQPDTSVYTSDELNRYKTSGSMPMRAVMARPNQNNIELLAMFPQTWGSTSLGFGGLGGASVTRAYTCVIRGPEGTIAIYFDGRLAYTVAPDNDAQSLANLHSDIQQHSLAGRASAIARYKASCP